MHELGILYQAVRTVNRFAQEHHIAQIKHITLEIGKDSGFVPVFLKKLFPVAAEHFSLVQHAKLNLLTVPVKSLQIKDIGY